MITLQSYSYNCANGNVADQTSTPLNAAFADEKVLILNYLSDVSLLNSEIRFSLGLFVDNFQARGSFSPYYFLPFSASTTLGVDINLVASGVPDSNKLVYAKINFVDNFTFTIKIRFFNTYDKGDYIQGVNPINNKQLLVGSFSVGIGLDTYPSAYNTPKNIGVWVQQKTSSTATTVSQYDYFPISLTFLNFGVMNTPVFSLLVNGNNSNVVSIDTPTTINFKVNYNQPISKIRYWILDYTNATNNSINFTTAYNAQWIDAGTVTESPIGTFNASYVANQSLFTNGNTYYFIAVCYDSTSNVVNSFLSQAFTAAGTAFCTPTLRSYFKDYLNEELTSNIKTSPYDRLQSVVKYTSNCSNITSITLSYADKIITATKTGATFLISDSAMNISVTGNTTTILYDFRVLSEWANSEVIFNWVILNDNEYKTFKFYQRIEVQEFQDVTPVKLIATRLFDLSNTEIEVEDLCNYEDAEFVVETEVNDATSYKQLAIFDNGGEISEEESFVGKLPQLTSLDLNDVDEDYIATKARFKADYNRTFGGILASIAKKKVDFYYARYFLHERGNTTPENIGNFYPYITIPITDTIVDFDFTDVLGASILVEYKFREGITPDFSTLPLIDKSTLLGLLAARTGDCDIEIHPTLQNGLSDGVYIFSFIKLGIASANSLSYNFANTLSSTVLVGFDAKIILTSIVGAGLRTYFRIISDINVDFNSLPFIAPNIIDLNAAIALQTSFYAIQIIDFTQSNITLNYNY